MCRALSRCAVHSIIVLSGRRVRSGPAGGGFISLSAAAGWPTLTAWHTTHPRGSCVRRSPAIQGRGIGTSIIRNLQSEAAEADTELDLGVELDNPRARELYERLGFTAIGQDDTELVMRWTPGPGPGTAYDGQIAADHPMGHLP